MPIDPIIVIVSTMMYSVETSVVSGVSKTLLFTHKEILKSALLGTDFLDKSFFHHLLSVNDNVS